MVYNIEYNRIGKLSYLENISYLENNWSKTVLENYLNRIENIISLIEVNPKMFTKWKDSNVRKVLIVPQITMFYEVEKDTIQILLFWNNYQNPDKLKELIEI